MFSKVKYSAGRQVNKTRSIININQKLTVMLPNKTCFYTFISIILFALTFSACTDSPTGVESEEDTATIHGSVDDNSSQAKSLSSNSSSSAYVVMAGTVNSDGSISMIEGSETEVSADGSFSMEVNVETANHIVVIAESSSAEFKGFISSELENNQNYTLKPLNAESTAETEVFIEVVTEGAAEIVQKSDIQLAVDAEAAAELSGNSSAVAEVATALKAYAEARAEFFAEKASETALELAAELRAEAQLQLETALDAAGSESEREAAIEAFVEASAEAYAEAGLSLEDVSKLLHLKIEVIEQNAANLSAEVKNKIRKALSVYASAGLEIAMNAQAESSNASESTVEAIVEAGVQLRSEIESSSGASGEIRAAFDQYHEEVRAAFENDSSAEASVVVTVGAEINANGAAKAEFHSMLDVLFNLSMVTEPYTEFRSAVLASVEAASEGNSEVQSEAVTSIIVLMNLHSS